MSVAIILKLLLPFLVSTWESESYRELRISPNLSGIVIRLLGAKGLNLGHPSRLPILGLIPCCTTSRRLADRKVERFEKNITKRGTVPETSTKKGSNYPVGPILLGFFIFVVIGSYCQDGNKWRHGLTIQWSIERGVAAACSVFCMLLGLM
ncbi:hypothetical protein ACH5RR_035458 [Cinchona calisaya]|uniref:Uncharacterized protein n=1 Tax=Cinchona calisaya TaxID=153742 RepID=A0ABD2Y3S6_9GENT